MAYLPDLLRKYTTLQHEFKLERPFYVEGQLVGYQLMNFENERMFLIGSTLKAGSLNEALLPVDLLKAAQKTKWKSVIGAGDRIFIVEGFNLRWDPPFEIKGILVAKVRMTEVKGIEINMPVEMNPPVEAAQQGEKINE
jgi:hypothetical protein